MIFVVQVGCKFKPSYIMTCTFFALKQQNLANYIFTTPYKFRLLITKKHLKRCFFVYHFCIRKIINDKQVLLHLALHHPSKYIRLQYLADSITTSVQPTSND